MLNMFLRGPEVSEGILGLSDSRDLALLPGEYDGFRSIVVSPTIPGASPGIFESLSTLCAGLFPIRTFSRSSMCGPVLLAGKGDCGHFLCNAVRVYARTLSDRMVLEPL